MNERVVNEKDLENKKFLVTGIQGTGKTYFVKEMSKYFSSVAVYTPHPEEWEGVMETKGLLFDFDDFVEDFENFLKMVLKFKDRIDLVIIDEFDLLFRGHFDTLPKRLRDLIINHRHYELSLMFCTRRIQDIPTRISNQIENLILFSVQSPQALDMINRWHKGMGDKVKNLEYGKHHFVYKKIGQEPFEAVL